MQNHKVPEIQINSGDWLRSLNAIDGRKHQIKRNVPTPLY